MTPTSNINKSQSFKITKKPIIEPVQKTNPNSKKKKKKQKPQFASIKRISIQILKQQYL